MMGQSPEDFIRKAPVRWIEFIQFIDARAHTRWVFSFPWRFEGRLENGVPMIERMLAEVSSFYE